MTLFHHWDIMGCWGVQKGGDWEGRVEMKRAWM